MIESNEFKNWLKDVYKRQGRKWLKQEKITKAERCEKAKVSGNPIICIYMCMLILLENEDISLSLIHI